VPKKASKFSHVVSKYIYATSISKAKHGTAKLAKKALFLTGLSHLS
jgi:hypothetical protein